MFGKWTVSKENVLELLCGSQDLLCHTPYIFYVHVAVHRDKFPYNEAK
jgi:hypothetical protein